METLETLKTSETSKKTFKLVLRKPSQEASDGVKSEVEFSLDKDTSVSTSEPNESHGNLTLMSMSYDKQMYKPGYLKVVIEVGGTTSFNKHDYWKKYFLGREVNLEIYEEKVIRNYVVFGIDPVYTVDGLSLTLHIYSPDYWMTLDKYCKCYVHKRLGSEIFASEVKKFGFNLGGNNEDTGKVIEYEHLSFLNIKYKESGSSTKASVEMIQPYLVQYNESFYDFMARTANRCGEPFYYEDGKLILGTSSKYKMSDAMDLEGKYEQVSFHDYVEERKVVVEDWSRNSSLVEDGKDGKKEEKDYVGVRPDYVDPDFPFPAESSSNGDSKADSRPHLRYNSALPGEEHFLKVAKKSLTDGEDFLKAYCGNWSKLITRIFAKILSSTNIYDGIANLVVDEGLKAAIAAANVAKMNGDFNETYIKDGVYSDEQMEKDGDNILSVWPFSIFTNDKKMYENVINNVEVDGKFYTDIRAGEMKTSRNMLEAVISVSEEHRFRLGSFITFGDVTYVVVQVNDSIDRCKNDGIKSNTGVDTAKSGTQSGTESNKEIWSQKQTIKALRVLTKGNDCYYYPLPLPGGTIRTCEPQVAHVTHNDDPNGLGRVRVRYPWQEKSNAPSEDTYSGEVSSPWIRVVSPMAFKGGGFTLRPQVGSEVMLNYQNGNVERPYVEGGLFSAIAPADRLAGVANIVMKSPNGHFVRMSTPDSALPFALGVASPVVQGFFAPFSAKSDKDVAGLDVKVMDRGLAGSIDMGDKFGIVGLNISTQDRKIDIRSPFGTVSISAFQGISINAPNGDISIKGKNVKIEASNNLSITSGLNIKDKMSRMDNGFFKNLGNSCLNVLKKTVTEKVLDLSLLRNVVEVIIRPCEGTLKIKSYRYMQLEAGNGKTTIAYSNIDCNEDDKAREKVVKDRQNFEKLVRAFNLVPGDADELVLEYISHFKRIHACANHYDVLVKACANDAVKADVKDAKTLIEKKMAGADLTAADVFDNKKNPQSFNQENEIVDAANRLKKSVNCLSDFVKSDNIVDRRMNFYFDVMDVDFDKLSYTLKKYIPVKAPDEEGFFDSLIKFMGNLTGNTLYYRKVIRRQLIHKMVESYVSHDRLIYKKDIGQAGANPSPVDNVHDRKPDEAAEDYANDSKWKAYVEKVNVKSESEKVGLLTAVLDKVNEIWGFNDWGGGKSERAMWGVEQRGQILMSDTPTETYAVEHGALVKMQNDGDNKNKTLQRILLGC